MISGSKVIYKKLLEHGVKDVFMYSGGAIMPLIDEFYKGRINYYVNSHEQNCGHAATGYAKSTGKTGISIVTSGPGITNSVTPLLDATNDSTPLIVLSGNVSTTAIGTNAFQEAPAVNITKPTTKWSYCVKNPNEISDIMDHAFKLANNRKKGAVHIDFPKDILVSKCEMKKKKLLMETRIDVNIANKIRKISDVINNSEKPILYVGQGCKYASEELTTIALSGNIPVTTTLHAVGVFDETYDGSLKMCGMHGSAYSNYALQNADCIIAIGSRFDDRTTGNLEHYAPVAREKKQIIHINIEPSEINNVLETDYNIIGDCKYILKIMIKYIKNVERNNWNNQIMQWKMDYPFTYTPRDNLLAQEVISKINDAIDDDYIITTGVGNHQMYTAQFINWKHPNRLITSGSLGVMGAGLGYAIGAQIGNKNKKVLCIDGDSSFMMTLSDLKTIKEHNLPIKIAIMNNNTQNMVYIWEKLFFDKRHVATQNYNNPDFVMLARAYGITAFSCSSSDDLDANIDYFLNHNGPILCEFKVENDFCFPLVAPGKALDDMILKEIDTLEGSAPC